MSTDDTAADDAAIYRDAELQFNVFQAALIRIERGRPFVIDGREVGPADVPKLRAQRDHWQGIMLALLRRERARAGGTLPIGRRLGGTSRRFRLS